MVIGAWIPAAIAGGASLVNGIMDLFGQSSANEQNVAMQRETNALNYQMFQESQEFAKAQQQLVMEYNDPSAQAQRLRAAGVNPASVFGNGSVSEVSAMNPPSATPMVAPQVRPLDYSMIGNSLQFANDAFFKNQLVANEAKKAGADASISETNALFERQAFANKLAIVANDKSKSDYERETARLTLGVLNATTAALIKQENVKADLLDEQVNEIQVRIESQKLANQIAEIDLKWHDKEKSAQYGSFLANIANAYASARAHDAGAAASYANAALADAEAAGVHVDNQTKKRVQEFVIDKAASESLQATENVRKTKWERIKARREAKEGYLGAKFLPSGLIGYYFGD